jgi:hypothetical protein
MAQSRHNGQRTTELSPGRNAARRINFPVDQQHLPTLCIGRVVQRTIQPLLKGKSFIIRFADDYLLGFTSNEDALRMMEVLPKRLGKFGLTLHPEKTRLIDLGANTQKAKSNRSFDFLGFTHYMGKSRKGNLVLMRKTSSKKLNAALIRMDGWMDQKEQG